MNLEEEQRRIEREAHDMDMKLLKLLPEKFQELFGAAEAAMNKQGRDGKALVPARTLRAAMIYLAREMDQTKAVSSALNVIGTLGCQDHEELARLREWTQGLLERILGMMHPLTACADDIAKALKELKTPPEEDGEKKE